jgi:transcriptional regulator with XRE-family HTH domain
MNKAFKFHHLTGIAAIRRDLGYTQTHLARLLNISRSTLSMAESGRRSLTSQALLKIAELELRRVDGLNKAEKADAEEEPAAADPVSSLTSKEECLALIDHVKREKNLFDLKKCSLSLTVASTTGKLNRIDENLALLDAEMEVTQRLINANIPTLSKSNLERKMQDIKYRKLRLVYHKEKVAIDTIFKSQVAIAGTDAAISSSTQLLQRLNYRILAFS